LHKGIKSQEDVEKILQRGIHCGDGKIRKYEIGYNSDFDGVLITSDDYYNYSDYDDAGNEVDERTGKPWGPYEYVEFHGNDLDESTAEGNTKPVDDAQQKQDKYASDTAAMAQGEIVNKLPRTLPTDRKDPKMGMQEQGQQKGTDYRNPPEADYSDDYQAMVSRVKKLAGLGPLKTVYDPQKRVYKNVPTATQPGDKK
jgi:hypothetical protein